MRSCVWNGISREIHESLLVCKDMRNLYWMVSWNSNNHSRSCRVEWIMSWGVAGGPSLWIWLSLRHEGDLPCGWLGDNCLCPNSAKFGKLHRCKPPRAQCRLHNPDIESRIIYIIVICFWLIILIWIVWFLLILVSSPFLFMSVFPYAFCLLWSPAVGVSRAESRWRCPSP